MTIAPEDRGPIVIVGSLNSAKVDAVRDGFEMLGLDLKEILGVHLEDAPAQPVGDPATLRGAERRVKVAREKHHEASYWVGIEGGVELRRDGAFLFAWVVVADQNGNLGRSRSASYELPRAVAGLINRTRELGDVVAEAGNTSSRESGLISLLTHGRIDRRALYGMPVALALVRLQPEWSAHSVERES